MTTTETTPRKSLTRAVRKQDAATIKAIGDALRSHGTLKGAAKELSVHQDTVARAVRISELLQEAHDEGTAARLARKEEELQRSIDAEREKLSAQIIEEERKLKEEQEELLRAQATLFSNQLTSKLQLIEQRKEKIDKLKHQLKNVARRGGGQ